MIRFHNTHPIRCGKIIHENQGDDWKSYRTPQYALVYLKSGKAWYQDEDINFVIEAGNAFQRFPMKAHQVRYAKASEEIYLALPAQVYEIFKIMDLTTLHHPFLELGEPPWILRRHKSLHREFKLKHERQRAFTINLMQQFLTDIHLHAMKRRHLPIWFEQAREQLCDIDQFDSSIEEIASACQVGYSLFRIKFKQFTGLSPGNYRIQNRIRMAQDLLLQDRSIQEIALALKYDNVYAFSNQFKKFTGHSPSSWRHGHET